MSRKVWATGTAPSPALTTPGASSGTAAICSTVVAYGKHRDHHPGVLGRGRAAVPAPPISRAASASGCTSIALMADRTFAKFTFFKLDPAWQRRDPEARAEDKREFLAACEDYAIDRSLRAYSTVGTRGDTDLMLLSQSPVLEDIHTFHVVLAQSGLAQWMSIPHSYLAMTKPSPYSESQARPEICTSERKYCIVYPLDKKREWYRCRSRSAAG